jgi:isoleucyl-tRNA synthetase
MAQEKHIPEKSDAALREERILAFWKERDIFQKSLKKESPNGEFIFYEGPPTANARPAVHHLASRAFKDALPRYKTMRGFHVPRRAGWDTHGLPVELQIEKELGFTGKKDIEAYGVAAFNAKCRDSVFTYIEEWEKFTTRIGYWVDQEAAYYTFNPDYMESVWALLKQISDAGRLYKDYKVLPWCARCGTALSSHELAQGYEEVKDLSVTAQFELVNEPGTYVLAWTTTPWTLPGNIALAVGSSIFYVYVKTEHGIFIVAKERVEAVFANQPYEIVKEVPGSELVGMQYHALFPYAPQLASETEKPKFEKAFQIYPADFVTTEEGTGVVHTAVMYGQDDFELGTHLGLPKVHTVGVDGRFLPGTGPWEGRFVKEQDESGKPTLAVDIINDLKERNLFFSQENYKHTYPFCWRCKTPLIYFARDSWYLRMHDLRQTMVEENRTVNWQPEHIREGRMGEWLSGAKEWALSRERYWGTPLPIWENKEKEDRIIIGSVEELRARTKKSGNTYYAMRHGEAENNILDTASTVRPESHHLTENGKDVVRKNAERMQGVDLIFASPFTRTHETAEIVRETLGLAEDAVIFDERLREISIDAQYEGVVWDEYRALFNTVQERFEQAPGQGETLSEVRRRMGEFMYDLESRYKGKRILIVSHGDPLWVLRLIASGSEKKTLTHDLYPTRGVVQALDFVPLSHNENYELDLHRPFIDDVVLISDTGAELTRVKEVMDVWFDSGAMPYAQDHYPFENKEWVDGKGFPADFICEAIDQTRGWFYTLLAIGVLTGHGTPYKNVICLGHLLDGEGKKMSKSKGNIVNPWEAIERYGADTLRFWMYWVNQPGDSKSFDEKTLKEAARILSWFEHSAKFYALFALPPGGEGTEEKVLASQNILDRWMVARVEKTIAEVTGAMDAFLPYEATRAVGALMEDVSQWYVRRVRDRVRDGDREALHTLRYTLRTCALLIAPFSPFIAEDVFAQVRQESDPESVHLCDWPTVTGATKHTKKNEEFRTQELVAQSEALLADMALVRELASSALMLRQKVNIKVRQPLQLFTAPVIPVDAELIDILKDEINVKEVRMQEGEMTLDIALSPELVAEGDFRTFMRSLAEARKSENLSPKDTVSITFDADAEGYAKPLFDYLVAENITGITFSPNESDSWPYSVETSFGVVRFSIHTI